MVRRVFQSGPKGLIDQYYVGHKMKELPSSNASLLVRTDYSSPDSWNALLEVLSRETPEGFRAYFVEVDDKSWEGATPEALRAALRGPSRASVLFVADRLTLATADYPVLAIDLSGDHPPFRCVASELYGPENNLNIANMDFYEFARAAGPDGVFRGFPRREPGQGTLP